MKSKASTVSRRQFLRGDIHGDHRPLRPPWAAAEADFLRACDRCGRCIEACPEGVLKVGSGGFPVVDFQHGECTFCESCVEACRPGVLRIDHDAAGRPEAPWNAEVRIGDHCIANQGVVCQICGEQCETRAIRFRRAVGGRVYPEVDNAECSGCGACVAPCPVRAITVNAASPREEPKDEKRSMAQ